MQIQSLWLMCTNTDITVKSGRKDKYQQKVKSHKNNFVIRLSVSFSSLIRNVEIILIQNAFFCHVDKTSNIPNTKLQTKALKELAIFIFPPTS